MKLKNGNNVTKEQIEDFEILVAKVFVVSEEAGYKLIKMVEEGRRAFRCHLLLGCIFCWDLTVEGHEYWYNISCQVDCI